MPDISMCNATIPSNEENVELRCGRREKCYRFMAIPSEYRQAYLLPDVVGDKCEYFWKLVPGMIIQVKE